MQNQLHIFFAVMFIKIILQVYEGNLLYKYNKVFSTTISWNSEKPLDTMPKLEKYVPSGGGGGGGGGRGGGGGGGDNKLNVNTSNTGHRSIKAEEHFVRDVHSVS